MSTFFKRLRTALEQNATLQMQQSTRLFFKEEIKCYGVKSPTLKRIGKDFYKEIPQKEKTAVFALCKELWESGYLEESIIACQWSYAMRKFYLNDDFKIFEKWIDTYVTNWASCDTFCNHTVGTFIEMYPDFIANLKKWTHSPNQWMRRAAAVSLIVPAKKGMFLPDVFEIADILLLDTEDMVQKGYGWMLKVTAHCHENAVFEFVCARKKEMPRTALRYAIEKMPAKLKAAAMQKA
jgi:3-methyladenine DNA glycosylase AlkD